MPDALPDLSIRTADPADAPCIGVLGIQVFLDTYATDGVRPALAREVLQSLAPGRIEDALRAGDTFLAAEIAEHLVGFAQLGVGAGHELVTLPRPAELKRLYVQPRFAGRGIGTALIDHAEACAAAHGAGALWLTAWVHNERARRFYARRGYTEAGVTAFVFEGESHENRLYVKALVDARARPPA
jgi:diamine N-acetyltransferase